MGLLNDTRFKFLLAGFVLSVFALVGITAFGLLAVLTALGTASAEASLVFTVLEAAAPYIVTLALVGMLSFFLLVGLVVVGVRQASVPRDDRLARLARAVERRSPVPRDIGLADRLEPTTEDRIDRLKQQYVEGEITELEYERRLQDLMDEEGVSDERVRSERGRTDREFER